MILRIFRIDLLIFKDLQTRVVQNYFASPVGFQKSRFSGLDVRDLDLFVRCPLVEGVAGDIRWIVTASLYPLLHLSKPPFGNLQLRAVFEQQAAVWQDAFDKTPVDQVRLVDAQKPVPGQQLLVLSQGFAGEHRFFLAEKNPGVVLLALAAHQFLQLVKKRAVQRRHR